jgi:hypothetical protein
MAVTAPTPDVYEIAFLAGGPDRVVDTALVVLVESGRVRVHAPGELAAVEPVRRHPVEAAVLDAVGTHGHRSIDTIRWRLAGDARITGLGRSLAAAGLARHQRFPGRDAWRPTRAGRQLLDRLAEQPPALQALDGGSGVPVALHGRAAMADAELRASIFERPALPEVPAAEIGRRVRERRRLQSSDDPARHAAYGGAAIIGLGGADGVDGGGF